MKIAITGGSGFIGTRLIKGLKAEGHEIVIVDIVHDTPIDVLDQENLNDALKGCDVIYHLAAAHRDDVFPRSIYYDVNVTGMKNVVEAANVNNIKHIIFTSSVALYGLDAGTPNEKSTPDPFNDYGKSKWQAEQVLQEWNRTSADNKVTIIRPVVVFGENNRGNVYTLIKQIQSRKFVMIGAGKNKKSMAYVGNVADFLQHCMSETAAFEVYNYADKPDMRVRELVTTIKESLGMKASNKRLPYVVGLVAGYVFDLAARMTGKTLPISSVRIKKFCADTTVDATKAHTGAFKAKYSLAEGVQKMIAHDFMAKK